MIQTSFYIKLLIFFMLLIWCTGIFFPVLSVTTQSYLVSHIFLDKIYSLVCHQENSKSYFFSGIKIEVCARCTGIYLGALIISIPGMIFSKLKFHSKKILLLSIGIMTADVFLYSVGFYHYSRLVALLTGLILGSVSIPYIFEGINEYFSEVKNNPNVQ